MKRKFYFFLLPLAICFQLGYCQQKPETETKSRVLVVGDKMPEYEFVNLVNHPNRTVNLSAFKGKLLILDFWSTSCASCIESWGKLESLQKEFDGKIQILLVNPWNDQTIVNSLIEKRRKLGIVNLTLPSSCKDKAILELFPVTTVPHIVWIDDKGIIKSITYGDALNSKNIKGMLNNVPVTMHQKTDLELEVNYRKPLFINGNGGDEQDIKWQAILTKYVDGMGGTLGMYSSDRNGYSIYAVNQCVLDLYRFAYSDRMDMHERNITKLNLNKVELHVKDSSKYLFQVNHETNYENLFVYQLISGIPVSPKELQRMMQLDLERYFGLNVTWTKRVMKCLVFSVLDTASVRYQSGETVLKANDSEFKFNNITFTYLIKYLEDITLYHYSPYPLINETHYHGKIGNINIEGNTYDYRELAKGLAKYGIGLKLEERPVDLLILSEKDL